MSSELDLPIDYTLRKLCVLDNAGRVAQYLEDAENREIAEKLVIEGFNQLIDRFNLFGAVGHDLLLDLPELQNCKRLFDVLGGRALPHIEGVGVRDFIRGMKEAKKAMIAGQIVASGGIVETKDTIRTPSMDTHELALIIGTSGHLYERAMFNFLRGQGIGGVIEDGVERPWSIDNILHALEECAVLLHVESETDGVDSILLPYMLNPNSRAKIGGLGWRNADQIKQMEKSYKETLCQIVECG